MQRKWCTIFCVIFTFVVFFTPFKMMALDGESQQEIVSTVEESEASSEQPSSESSSSESSSSEQTSSDSQSSSETSEESSSNEEQSQGDFQPQEQPQESFQDEDSQIQEDYIEDYDYEYYTDYYGSVSSENNNVTQNVISEADSQSSSDIQSELEPIVSSSLDIKEDLSLQQLLGTGIEVKGENNKFVGIIAWICVIVGLAIIAAVLLSGRNNKKGKNFIGRKRYKSYGKVSRNKGLLKGKYYNNKYR